jgi:CubicO group peptidase (beta-lactamase class C family)
LLSEAGCRRALEEQSNGMDLVLGVPIRFGMGYGLMSDLLPLSPNPNACFWGGWGGSLVLVDLDARTVITYVMNRMGLGTLGDVRGLAIADAAYTALAS